MRILKSMAAWLGRLSVSRKLTLIYLLDLTAVIYISGILVHEKYLAIDFTRKEVVGLTYSNTVRDLLMAAVRAPNQGEVGALVGLQSLALQRANHDVDLQADRDSAVFVARWQAWVDAGDKSPTSLKSVIQGARTLITTVGNQSNLILDPDLDSYYSMSLSVLRFPELVEVLNEAAQAVERKHGLKPVNSANRALQGTALLIQAGRLDAIAQAIRADYKQAYSAGSKDFRDKLLDHQLALERQIEQLLALTQSFAEQDVTANDLQLFMSLRGHTLKALELAWGSTSGALDGLLKTRVDGLFAKMWLHLGTALALLFAILGLVYLVARLIASPLKQLANVANEVRQSGNYNLRAKWQSQDEIGHLVTTFNGMLGQLDQDRVTREELRRVAVPAAWPAVLPAVGDRQQ